MKKLYFCLFIICTCLCFSQESEKQTKIPVITFNGVTPIISNEIIESFRSNLKSANSEQLIVNEKYSKILLATKAMKEGANIIDFSTSLIWLEESISDIQSIWNNEKIRNVWDQISNAGTSIGLVAASIIQIIPSLSNEDKLKYSGISIGVSGIATILGYFLGDNSPLHIEDSILTIELSRQAYDDLKERKNYIQRYIEDTNEFKNELIDIEEKYNKLGKNASNEEKVEIINKVKEKLVEFDKILDCMNVYFNSILDMKSISIFSKKIEKIDKLTETRKALSAIIEDALLIKMKYNNVIIPQIRLSDELKTLYSY